MCEPAGISRQSTLLNVPIHDTLPVVLPLVCGAQYSTVAYVRQDIDETTEFTRYSTCSACFYLFFFFFLSNTATYFICKKKENNRFGTATAILCATPSFHQWWPLCAVTLCAYGLPLRRYSRKKVEKNAQPTIVTRETARPVRCYRLNCRSMIWQYLIKCVLHRSLYRTRSGSGASSRKEHHISAATFSFAPSANVFQIVGIFFEEDEQLLQRPPIQIKQILNIVLNLISRFSTFDNAYKTNRGRNHPNQRH